MTSDLCYEKRMKRNPICCRNGIILNKKLKLFFIQNLWHYPTRISFIVSSRSWTQTAKNTQSVHSKTIRETAHFTTYKCNLNKFSFWKWEIQSSVPSSDEMKLKLVWKLNLFFLRKIQIEHINAMKTKSQF